MIVFLKKVSLFAACISIILALSFFSFYIHFEIPKINKGTIPLIGDSTGRNSVDTRIAEKYTNFSQGGDSYIYMYHKVVNLHKIQKIDTLLVSFAPNNIFNNTAIEDVGLKGRGRYLPMLTADENILLFRLQPGIFLSETIKQGYIGIKNLFHETTTPVLFGSYLENNKIYEENYYIPKSPPPPISLK